MNNQHDPFEEQLRSALRGQSGQSPDPDVDSFLDQVHRGARRRRTTRIVAGSAAAVCLVVGGSFALAISGVLDDGGRAPIADETTGTSLGSESPNSILSATSPGGTSGGSVSSDTAPRFTAEQVVALDITATGNSHQWILGSVPGGDCDAKRCLHVFQTENAGGSWADLGELPAHPIVGTEDGGSVGGLRFAGDGTNGWAFRGALLGTHDGGETWIPQEVPVRGNVIQVETWGEDALAVTYDGESASLIHSEVASDTWEVVPFAEQADLTDPRASVGEVAISKDAAIMTASVAVGNQFAGTVLISEDGGRSWRQPASSGYCVGQESPSLVSVTGDSLWVSCTTPQGRTTISVTSDLGATWERTAGTFGLGAPIGGRDADSVAVAEGAGAYQVSATEVWLTQVPATSQPQRIGTFGDSAATMVEFTNPEVGYIVFDGGGLLRTGDGGQSWAPFGVTNLE